MQLNRYSRKWRTHVGAVLTDARFLGLHSIKIYSTLYTQVPMLLPQRYFFHSLFVVPPQRGEFEESERAGIKKQPRLTPRYSAWRISIPKSRRSFVFRDKNSNHFERISRRCMPSSEDSGMTRRSGRVFQEDGTIPLCRGWFPFLLPPPVSPNCRRNNKNPWKLFSPISNFLLMPEHGLRGIGRHFHS